MRRTSTVFQTLALSFVLLAFTAARAAEVNVMISGGFSAAFRPLATDFERTTGNKVVTVSGPSMGDTTQAIPSRMRRGEPVDVVIMVGYALGDLIKQGNVVADGRVDLAQSRIGMAVRAGASRPDISSVDAFRRALLAARSIAYSDSASGVYISTELFQHLGILDEVKGKSRMIPAEPVGAVVARGDAEIGLQQISELLPVPGIEFVGPLPAELQKITIFSAGIASAAKEPEAAKSLIKFLASPMAQPVIAKTGLDPMPAAERK
jgi:molybdate transport system substrate-binding protein